MGKVNNTLFAKTHENDLLIDQIYVDDLFLDPLMSFVKAILWNNEAWIWDGYDGRIIIFFLRT